MKRTLISIIVTVAVLAVPAWAQVAPSSTDQVEERIPTVKFTLHPAAEPREALKYQLLPGFLDRKPGNAAVIYNKVGLAMRYGKAANNSDEGFWEWREMPLAELPREEIEKTLARYDAILKLLDRAARQETCDWELSVREENPLTILLPEVQGSRQYARLLAVKARLEIARGQFDDAIHTLQTGYALGRHVAEGPTLISALIGITICDIMSKQVEELIQQPGSPNLYWALTWLPRPIISVRKAAEAEMETLYLMFPELRDVGHKTRDAAYWRALLDRMSWQLAEYSSETPPSKWRSRLLLTLRVLEGYPRARRTLIDEGRPAAEVDAMPVAQVVLIYTVHTYNEFRDRVFRWIALPYWEAREGMNKTEQYLCDEGPKREIIPVASVLVPAVMAVKGAEARAERNIAMLRTLAALRMYAAGHEGRLPSRLEEVTEVPVPIDPMTGKSFVYECHGDTAVLEATPEPLRNPELGKRYEIKVAK